MIQKGSLPVSGQITFDFSEERLILVAAGKSPQDYIHGVISFPDQPEESDKSINLVVTKVYPANTLRVRSKSVADSVSFKSLFNDTEKYTFSRVRDYLNNQILIKLSWLLAGYLDNDDKTPIMILYVPELETGAYSLKKESEMAEEFDVKLN